MDMEELSSIVESLIFSSPTPVTVSQLKEWIDDPSITEKKLNEVIALIRTNYEQRSRGIRLMDVADGLQFRTPRQNGPWVRRLLEIKPLRLSPAALEVLAIIAYKQPVMRSEVESIRGVDSSHLLKLLMERKLVRMDGKTDDPGRPILYSTTPEFLELFSIKSIRDLPTLRDLEELTAFGDQPAAPPAEDLESVEPADVSEPVESTEVSQADVSESADL